MFAIGNDELEELDDLGDFILCDKCGERHLIDYGKEVMKDGSKKKTKFLAFYKCGGKAYLAGINGKRI